MTKIFLSMKKGIPSFLVANQRIKAWWWGKLRTVA
jgi:hypothetical protein